MNVDYFIKKFRSIPEALWTRGFLYNDATHQKCAMGHCDNTELIPLKILFGEHLGLSVHHVNDGYTASRFDGITPKKRILAALEYIKSKL